MVLPDDLVPLAIAVAPAQGNPQAAQTGDCRAVDPSIAEHKCGVARQ